MVYLDGVGLDHWEGSKAFLKGKIRGIVSSDEICVVFMYPGYSTHQAIRSTKSSTQYIYLRNTSGDYDLAANGRYIPFENQGLYGIRIIDVSGNCGRWSGERDLAGLRLTEPVAPDTVYLDGVGLDHWEGSKAFLKGKIRDIAPSDEICVVFMYPGLSTHQAIRSTTSSTQYIYLKDTSGDYDLAYNSRYIPYENKGLYGVRIIDVSGNCENWSKERDLTSVTLTGGMIHVPVISSNIKSIGWLDPSTLEVAFLNGTLYRYYYVPLDVYMGMLEAPSKGKYFWKHIRCKTQSCTGGNIPYPYLRLK